MKYPYILGADSITIYINGEQYTADKTHQNFNKILKAVKKDKPAEKLVELFDTTKAVLDYCGDTIKIRDGVLYYEDAPLHNTLTNKIMEMMSDGFNIKPLVNFLKNLKENPSRTAQQELYGFLDVCSLPITEDGHFLAYKAVNADYTDWFSRKIDNSIGARVAMNRGDVCDDRNITCSDGLHFAQKSYAESFGSRDGHLMVLKINPRDVVSIPIDYNNTKGRCCEYVVYDEVENKGRGKDKYENLSVSLSDGCEACNNGDSLNYSDCPNCGYSYDHDEPFCSNCGEYL